MKKCYQEKFYASKAIIYPYDFVTAFTNVNKNIQNIIKYRIAIFCNLQQSYGQKY